MNRVFLLFICLLLFYKQWGQQGGLAPIPGSDSPGENANKALQSDTISKNKIVSNDTFSENTKTTARSDTTLALSNLPDTTKIIEIEFVNPKKTALFSAILPGLGQVYNKHYWKLPIIYGGAAVAAYFINDNYQEYQKFRRVYYGRESGDPDAWATYPEYDQSTIRRAMEINRRYLDISVLLTAVGYTLQIIDAAVFAHLKNFDMSTNISLRLQPVAIPNGGLGFGLVMRF